MFTCLLHILTADCYVTLPCGNCTEHSFSHTAEDRIVNPDMYQPLLPNYSSGGVGNSQSDCGPQASVNSLVAYGSMYRATQIHYLHFLTSCVVFKFEFCDLSFQVGASRIIFVGDVQPINYYFYKLTQNTILSYRKLSDA